MGVGALTAGVLGDGVFLLAGRKFSREHLSRTTFVLWASLLFGAALALRLWLGYSSQGFTTDTDTFKSWASLANQVGFSELYEQDVFLDYPPGYLYVLALLDRIRLLLGLSVESQAYTLLIKLPSLLAVSYTHLDVYKRQRMNRLLDVVAWPLALMEHAGWILLVVLVLVAAAVALIRRERRKQAPRKEERSEREKREEDRL